jgi:pyrroline-5-carboxylate reductase
MSLADAGPLVLVGAGRMGSALLEGWLANGLSGASVDVFDPEPPEPSAALIRKAGARLNPSPGEMPVPRVVVLAVKPQIMDNVLAGHGFLVKPGTLFLSIAAGRTIASLRNVLGATAPVVRVMPNTPAAIGRGMSVAVASDGVTGEQKALVTALLEAVGEAGWVDDEALMDAVTAVSGSGPAYVFHLAECLAEAGMAAGLPRELAEKAARATVAGAGELLHRSDLPAATLRENVTSPGGTTAAALEVLRGEDGLPELMKRAVAAATKRSRELSE